MAGKFYAVKKGKVPGIYTSWDACKSMVHGFPGAVYKGFATRAEAEQFLEEKKEEQKEPENYAFVDGSFNSATSVYGYGGFLVYNNEKVLNIKSPCLLKLIFNGNELIELEQIK